MLSASLNKKVLLDVHNMTGTADTVVKLFSFFNSQKRQLNLEFWGADSQPEESENYQEME